MSKEIEESKIKSHIPERLANQLGMQIIDVIRDWNSTVQTDEERLYLIVKDLILRGANLNFVDFSTRETALYNAYIKKLDKIMIYY